MTTSVKNYQGLLAWQTAMKLVEQVYTVTKSWPKEELYGLTNQVRRAAVSVPSNIAEGQGRRSTKEFLHHLSIAHGSLREVETQLLIAQRLNYLTTEKTDTLIATAAEAGRLIMGLSNELERRIAAYS